MFISSIFDQKYAFWVNLVQKLEIVCLSWNLVPTLIQICKIQWWCSLFFFWPETSFLGKFGPKNQNFQLRLKFGTYNTSHKFWDQSPSPHYQCRLQVSEAVSWHKLWCCYSANILQHWVGGRSLICFCKVDHSRIFRIFFQGLSWSQ